MKKALLYRLFGFGKLPAATAQALEQEGIIISDECVGGSVTHRNFRRPGRISNYRKVGLVIAIVVTNVSPRSAETKPSSTLSSKIRA